MLTLSPYSERPNLRPLYVPGLPKLDSKFPKPKKSTKGVYLVGALVKSHYGPQGTIVEVTEWESTNLYIRRPLKVWVYWEDKRQSEVYLRSIKVL